MYDNWADARSQLEQVLASERALRQARRRQQPSVWQRFRHWWAAARGLGRGVRQAPTTALSTPQR